MHKGKTFFPNLDGLRFVAFFAVFIQHSFNIWLSYHTKLFRSHFGGSIAMHLLHLGGNGVSCFFVLSGFLITYLLVQEKQRHHKISLPGFYMRRILRIWPLYYLLVVLEFAVFNNIYPLLGWKPSHLNFFAVISFLTNFNINHLLALHRLGGTVLGATWSVCVEEQFYLIWPLLFFIFSNKKIKYAIAAIVVLCYAYRFSIRYDETNLYGSTFSVCGDLAIGGLLGYYTYYSRKFRQTIASMSRALIYILYIAGFIWLYVEAQIPVYPGLHVFLRLGNCLFFAFVIAEQNFALHSFYKFENYKAISKWGMYTYGLYMLHPIAVELVRTVSRLMFPNFNQYTLIATIMLGIVILVISMIASYFSYKFFESRFLKFKDRFSTLKRQAIVAP